ncbi:MAG: transcription antitermination factor NusB, partial [Bryobacteraceae bacterium]|nr:transcription antitermination factor NusB [Bryobacteraceae bacterium]
MRRGELRQKALQALYQMDVGKAEADAAVHHVMSEVEGVLDGDLRYVQQLVSGTSGHLEELDELLQGAVEGWQLQRIAAVERNVLRLATYESLYELDVDVAVILDQAIELAKSFGSEESGRFVNGVLA